MFDLSSWELVVIGAVALVVLGPKELPNAVRAVTGFARKARALAHDFQSGLEEIARETELSKVKAEVEAAVMPQEFAELQNTIHQEMVNTISAPPEIKDTAEEIARLEAEIATGTPAAPAAPIVEPAVEPTIAPPPTAGATATEAWPAKVGS